jgi:hypothetical protein
MIKVDLRRRAEELSVRCLRRSSRRDDAAKRAAIVLGRG